MAAQPWKVFRSFREYLGKGTFDLSGDTFDISLHTSAFTTLSAGMSTYGSLANEVTSGNKYTTGGQQMSGITWTSVGTASFKFDSSNPLWTASGGNISNIKIAIIHRRSSAGGSAEEAGKKLLCYSTLSTSQFNVTTGNTLTIEMASSGVLVLS